MINELLTLLDNYPIKIEFIDDNGVQKILLSGFTNKIEEFKKNFKLLDNHLLELILDEVGCDLSEMNDCLDTKVVEKMSEVINKVILKEISRLLDLYEKFGG